MSTTATTQSVSQGQLLHCSFCSKSQEQVRQLVAGPNNVYICDACVDLAREIIEGHRGTMKTDD